MAIDEFKIEDPAAQRVTQAPAAPHPGAFIKTEVLAPFKVPLARVARLISMDRATLHNVLAGQHAVSRDLAYKLEALTGISADLLIAMQAAHDKAKDHDRREEYRRTITRLELPAGE